MGKLTTHVLDTANGRPGQNIRITLYQMAGQLRTELKTAHTNGDGRCDEPLLEGDAFTPGIYELVFAAGAYFRAQTGSVELPEPAFLDEVVVRFGIAHAEQHYHVPLLVSPYSYSTYRGS